MHLTRRQAVLGAAGAAGVAGLGAYAMSADGTPRSERTSSGRMPTAFVPHGGGPWPLLSLPGLMPDDEGVRLKAYMESIAELAGATPRALLVVSAHWEADVPTVNTGARPGMLYDYYNFPPAAYELQWPAPGDPELAGEVRHLLEGAGFRTAADADRGYDHGTFIPLLAAYPEADVPVVQLSLQADLDPAAHLAMGRALAPLRDQGVYILGSGNSFHNLRALFRERNAENVAHSHRFDAWLEEAVALPEAERDARLASWAKAPSAQPSHPREEHLIPLMVAAGAAGEDAGRVAWRGDMAGFRISAHHFG